MTNSWPILLTIHDSQSDHDDDNVDLDTRYLHPSTS